jgi:hypothetical protein
MTPSDSVNAFKTFLENRRGSLTALTVRSGIAEMLSFYDLTVPTGCANEDGDMLLFQWGSYDWGSGKHFEIDITRQFIEIALEDDDAISQLALTFTFAPDGVAAALGTGTRWCKSQHEIDAFREFITSNQAFRAKADLHPHNVSLRHEYV